MRDIDWFGRAGRWLAPLALLLALPAGLNAQFSIAPTIGVYIPTSPLVSAALGGPTPSVSELRQEVAISVGGRMSLGFGRFGMEVSGGYSPSTLVLSQSGVSTSADASLLTGTGQVWVQLLPTSSPLSLGLSGGVSLTSRGGEAYASATNTTNIGGVIGATVGFRVGPFVHLMVSVEDYIYNIDASGFGVPGVDVPTQHDIHLDFGIGIPLLGM